MNIHDKKEVESVTLQERLRQMASIAITHPQFTDYVNNALEAALEAADALDQKDAEIERLQSANESVAVCAKHVADVTRGDCLVCEIERLRRRCKPDAVVIIGDTGHYVSQAVKDEIERLQAHRDALQDECDEWADTCDKLQAEIERLTELTENDGKEIGSYRA